LIFVFKDQGQRLFGHGKTRIFTDKVKTFCLVVGFICVHPWLILLIFVFKDQGQRLFGHGKRR